jgi:hypothetical protein
VDDTTNTEDREAAHPQADSIRPVIQHALTVYYDGNAELARNLIDLLLAEKAGEQ